MVDLVEFLGFPSANMITGHRGFGKTAFGMKFLEDAHKRGLKAFVIGLPKQKYHLLPKFITPATSLDEIPDSSAIFMDEAYLYAYARDHPKGLNKFLSKIMGVSRQKKWILVFGTHTTRKLDVGIILDLDNWILRKPSHMHTTFERIEIRKYTLQVFNWFKKLEKIGKNPKEYAIVLGEDKPRILKLELPSFWTDELSNAFSGVSLKEIGVVEEE